MSNIAVLIPSYNRSHLLKLTLPTWLKAEGVKSIIVIAQSTREEELNEYEKIKKSLQKSSNMGIVFICVKEKLGSINARNILFKLAANSDSQYIVMVDDDYLLPNSAFLRLMTKHLQYDKSIGAVGGGVVMLRKRRIDPDFFLNLPMNLADLMSRLIGYVFLDIKHGPRYSEFLPPFFMIRRDFLNSVRYDDVLSAPTGFREESDFQLQIKRLGYRLLYDPRAYVIHLAAEEGGNRPKISIGKRMYWKARNHTIFILKWNKSILKRVWYIMLSALILSLYRVWCIPWIFRGVKDGICNSINIRSKFRAIKKCS